MELIASDIFLTDAAMLPERQRDVPANAQGGIDMNSANLGLTIKRDGKGVPLPLPQQDMAQLAHIQGFVAEILEVKPATALPVFQQ